MRGSKESVKIVFTQHAMGELSLDRQRGNMAISLVGNPGEASSD